MGWAHFTHNPVTWALHREVENEAYQPGALDLSTVMLVATLKTQNEYEEDKCR
jgi:hypothetical protein